MDPGIILHKLFHLAFQVGKRVRSETNIASGPRSVPGAALELLRGRSNERLPAAALVCGVNEMTEMLLEGLTRWGVPVYLANRSPEKAEKLAAVFRARVLPLAGIAEVIPQVEAIFSATSAPEHLITRRHFERFAPGENPLYLFDLAVPRDVEPAVNDLPGVVLLDLQDMKRYLEQTESIRSQDIPRAEAIIEEQVKVYSIWREKERQREKILKMHQELNLMRKHELEKFKEGFHLSEYRALDAFSQTLVRNFMKILPQMFEVEDGK